jgi:hypothetical protein
MAKRKSFEEKNNFIHPTRKKIIDTVFGRDDNTQKTFGYEGNESEKRKVGDVWTDSEGVTWEQKDGYKTNMTKLDDVRQYINSLKECKNNNCNTKQYSRIDKKLIVKTGMCLDCLQRYETKLKTDGTYPFYEDYKITRNKLAYARELVQRYESALNDVKDTIQFVNEKGEIENWKWEIDPEQVRKDIQKDIHDVSNAIKILLERKAALEEKLTELNHPELIVK